MGGGGGKRGGGDGGAGELRRQEAERQARITNATNRINNIFKDAGRDSLYEQQRNNVLTLNRDKINEGFTEAARQLRFAMARNGTFGGSYDVEQHKNLERKKDEGLIQAAQLADNAANSLRSQDENARASLLSLAQSGIDETSAAQQATARLAANADTMNQAAQQNLVGDIFQGLNQAYLGSQYNGKKIAATTKQGDNFLATDGGTVSAT